MDEASHTFRAGRWATWSNKLDQACLVQFLGHYGTGPFSIFHVTNNQDAERIGHHQLVEVEISRNHFVIFPGNCFSPAKKPPGRGRSKSRKTSK